MTSADEPEWNAAQRERLEQFSVERTVDIHCHCLPGLDDGPSDLAKAISLCAALAEDGITTVAATPHQLGRYGRLNSAEVIRKQVEQLVEALREEKIPLEILPGGDVRVDERLEKLVDNGEVGSLADKGRHLLLELPNQMLVDPLPSIAMLRERGMQAIMTHPERHPYLSREQERIQDWLDAGAVLQVTAGSLLGDFGRRASSQAWRLVSAGMASLVATDAHDLNRRPPRMTEAIAALTREVGIETARTLCVDNPLRVLRGERL